MIHDKGRLDQVFFYELFEEEVDDIAAHMTFFVVNTLLVCQLLSLFGGLDLVEVNSCIFLDRIYHSQTLERLA